MSPDLDLHYQIFMRFRNAFGEPEKCDGKDASWSLTSPTARNSVSVLLNGVASKPAVWVFDPNDAKHGVFNTHLGDAEEAAALIQRIQQRLEALSAS